MNNLVISQWENFLLRYRWQAYGILTFRRERGYPSAQQSAHSWFALLSEQYPQCFACIAYARGRAGGRFHLKVLLGGLLLQDELLGKHHAPVTSQKRQAIKEELIQQAIHHARKIWRSGLVIKLERIDNSRGAIRRIAEFYTNAETDIELLGKCIRAKRKRRRAKSKTTQDNRRLLLPFSPPT